MYTEAVRVETPVADGDQDVTIPGFGTPDAVIAIGHGRGALDTDTDDIYSAMSFWDGTTAVCATASVDATSTTPFTNAIARMNDVALWDMYAQVAGATPRRYTTATVGITDGIRNTWASQNGIVQQYILYIFIRLEAGEAVKVGNTGAMPTTPGTTEIATAGITPNCIIACGQYTNSVPQTTYAAIQSIGFAVKTKGVIRQRAFTHDIMLDGASTTVVAGEFFQDALFSADNGPFAGGYMDNFVTAMKPGGFTLETRYGSYSPDTSLNTAAVFMAFQLNSAPALVETHTPVDDGTWQIPTGVRGKPNGLLIMGTGFGPTNTRLTSSEAVAARTMYWTNGTQEFGISEFNYDNTGTCTAWSRYMAGFGIQNQAGAPSFIASSPSFNDKGVAFANVTGGTSPFRFFGLAFIDPAPVFVSKPTVVKAGSTSLTLRAKGGYGVG